MNRYLIFFLLGAFLIASIGHSSAQLSFAGSSEVFPGLASGDKLLAAGPIPVILTIAEKKLEDKEAVLLLLSEKRIIFQLIEKGVPGKLKKDDAKSSRIKTITTKKTNNQKTWKWDLDESNNTFTGKVKEADKIELPSSPKYSEKQTSQFLFFAHLCLVDQLEDAVSFDDPESTKSLFKQAEVFAEIIDHLNLDPNVGILFRNVRLYHDDLAGSRQKLMAAFSAAGKPGSDSQKMQDAAAAEDRCIASTQMTATGMAFLSIALRGDGMVTPDAHILKRLILKVRARERMEALKANPADAANVVKLESEFSKHVAARKERDKIVAKKLELPPLDWRSERLGEFATMKDWAKLSDRLLELQAQYEKAISYGDPWLQLEIYGTKSLVNFARFEDEKLVSEKIQRNADDRFKLAMKMFDVAKQIPGDDTYKDIRAAFVLKAAEHALEAAELEVGEKDSLKNVYNTKAIYVLRVLQIAESQKLAGTNWNEIKLRAMALAQMHKEALEIGSTLSTPRNPARFHLTMAKLHAIVADYKKLDASKDHMKRAIKAGFYDFGLIKNNADLSRLIFLKTDKGLISTEFMAENMIAEVSIRIVMEPKSKIVKAFELTNESPFPIINGTFSVLRSVKASKLIFPPPDIPPNLKNIPYLGPKASETIQSSDNISSAPFFQSPPAYGFQMTNMNVGKEWLLAIPKLKQ